MANSWTFETFRTKKLRTPGPTFMSQRQKRAEMKSVQKLEDFERERHSGNKKSCSKLPTPRSYHTSKPRLNLTKKFKSLSSKNLLDRFDKVRKIRPSAVVVVPVPKLPPNPNPLDVMPYEDDEIWECRNLYAVFSLFSLHLN